MWMGGTVPLGYDAIDKKLVVNPVEADTVRALFNAFVELRSVQATLRWSKQQGLCTKRRRRLGREWWDAVPLWRAALRLGQRHLRG